MRIVTDGESDARVLPAGEEADLLTAGDGFPGTAVGLPNLRWPAEPSS